MRIAIIDDEMIWRDSIKKAVLDIFNEEMVDIDIYKNGRDYLDSKVCYEITLVDIEMPEIDGFETIKRAREYNEDGVFIILTTHLEMSRKGYLVNAFRYVDKVHLKSELTEAIKSAEVLLGRNERIQVNVIGDGPRELVLKDIVYIATEKHYILVYTKNGLIRCNNTMAEMEGVLKEEWFFRCHNAFIVNLDEIVNIKDTIIYMSNGDDLDVSKRKYRKFKKLYIDRQYSCSNA